MDILLHCVNSVQVSVHFVVLKFLIYGNQRMVDAIYVGVSATTVEEYERPGTKMHVVYE